MKRQLQGIALILFSILLTLGFDSAGWYFVLDLSVRWSSLFMLLGAAGVALVFRTDGKEK